VPRCRTRISCRGGCGRTSSPHNAACTEHALAHNPFAIGIGLDENTAAFIAPDDALEVVGSGALTIVDPSV